MLRKLVHTTLSDYNVTTSPSRVHGARRLEAPARSFDAPARPDRVDSDGTPRFIAEKLDQAAWG